MAKLTKEQVRDRFLEKVRDLVDYWEKESTSERHKLEGLAFSILSTLDGSAADLPGFVVAPCPHPDDRDYANKRGEDYFPEAPFAECDISGSLHEHFYKR